MKNEKKYILVTGGAGYIGSHTVLALLQSGCNVIVLDNLCNSNIESIKRVTSIAGNAPFFVEGDVRDFELLSNLFNEYDIDSVIHFAGLKAVNESIMKPLNYYNNNVHGSQVLFRAMSEAGVYKIVFSSSATVYGLQSEMPISESCSLGEPINPYGRSKLMIEDILRDLYVSDSRWAISILRYFNPTGAHKSGLIGEDPNGIPNNLVPFISQVAIGKLSTLSVYGNDYSTIDGTGVRDYVHVVDLAEGHILALSKLQNKGGVSVWNLGTGKGYSVLEVILAFEQASNMSIPYQVLDRRAGDLDICYADATKAYSELGWKAKKDLSTMMEDVWRWQSMNPNGYL
jgi:UDP-glucose 4-epimerase